MSEETKNINASPILQKNKAKQQIVFFFVPVVSK